MIIPFLAILVLLSVNILLSRKGKNLYWVYEASHLAGGFLLAALLMNFLDKDSYVLLAVFTIGLLWEIYELIINKNKNIKKFLEDNFEYYIAPSTSYDTLSDLFLDVLGAAVYLYLF